MTEGESKFWLKWKRLKDTATIPTRKLDGAGYDLFPCEAGKLYPGETKKLALGFAAAFTPGYAAIVDDRSSTGQKNITHLAGVIDAGYRDEWQILVHNLVGESSLPFDYGPDKAIAQVLFVKVARDDNAQILQGDEQLPDSVRGLRGFGSTDPDTKGGAT